VVFIILTLWSKHRITLNEHQTFLKRGIRIDIDPFFGVLHESKTETIRSPIFQPGEFGFKEGRDGMWSRRTVLGAKAKIEPISFGIEINDVIEIVVLGWWLNGF
jgi:hypothetical protein